MIKLRFILTCCVILDGTRTTILYKKKGVESIVMKEKVEYSIGLDIGTTSVGFAAVDKNGKPIKVKDKKILGVRLFDAAESAESRRNFRSTRRRLIRRKNRLNLLKELIGSEVERVDPEFFKRLKESFKIEDDKEIKKSHIICAKNDKKLFDFFKKNPTIYHIRKELLESENEFDIRIIYLVLHHMLKRRGNFLYEGDFSKTGAIHTEMEHLLLGMVKLLNIEDEICEDEVKECIKASCDILSNNTIRKKEKEKQLNDQLVKIFEDYANVYKNVVKGILGYKADYVKIFNETETEEKHVYSFTNEIDEAKIEEVAKENMEFYFLMKNAYSSFALNEILKGDEYISFAMVNKYKKHKEDLVILKELYRNYSPEKFNDMFKNKKENNYVHYVRGEVSGNYTNDFKNKDQEGVAKQEELYKKIKKDLGIEAKLKLCKTEGHENDYEDIQSLAKEIEENIFLPKQKSVENASIPHQLNKTEMEKILSFQGKFHPILALNKEKILSILEFRIPYYVGPLNYNKQETNPKKIFAWAERKVENEKVFPWNFKDVFDLDKAAETFINRMRNKCTYLIKEDTMPKNSLINMEFNLLNELNKIRVNGRLIALDTKNRVIENLFKKTKKITEKTLVEYLKNHENIIEGDLEIQGFQKDKEFSSSLSSHIDFVKIFGKIDEKNFAMIEKIILWITIFNDNDIIENKIKTDYPQVTEKQIASILSLNYSGWSRISHKLINEFTTDTEKGTKATIMEIMRKTNYNFMQIINDDNYDFKTYIEENAPSTLNGKIKYDDILELQGSPAIKKSIWQSVKVIQEIEKIIGYTPKNIFIEFARNEAEKKRTTSRIKKLMDQYKDVSKEITYVYNKEVEKQLKEKNSEKNKLDNEMLYLYFMQFGKCMYSSKPLNINELSQTCEVDHVLPRAYIKDDSIANKVLVLKGENQRKTDNLLLNPEIIEKQSKYWHYLADAKLITKKKLYNLTRRTITDDDIQGFIARQLVETRQITKHVASLLTNKYKSLDVDTNIKTVRANLLSNFRHKYDFYKLRDLNDFHHAHDAYLACILGLFIERKYPKLDKQFDYNSYLKFNKENKTNIQNSNYGFVLKSFDEKIYDDETGELIWDAEKTVKLAKNVLNFKDVLISKKTEKQVGEFYNQKPNKKGRASIELKKGLRTDVYGGYSGKNIEKFLVIECVSKKKKMGKLIGIPRHISAIAKQDSNKLIEYIEKTHKCTDIKVLHTFNKNQEISWGDERYYIASLGDQGAELHNANQLYLSEEMQKRLKYCENILNNKFNKSKYEISDIKDLFWYLIDKIKNVLPKFNKEIEKLKDASFDNEEIKIRDISKLVIEIVKMANTSATNGNIKSIQGEFNLNGSFDRLGRMNSKRINPAEVEFIYKSVTGIYERRKRFEF